MTSRDRLFSNRVLHAFPGMLLQKRILPTDPLGENSHKWTDAIFPCWP